MKLFNHQSIRKKIFASVVITSLCCLNSLAWGQQPDKTGEKNHLVNYLEARGPIIPWMLSVGDERNWYVPIDVRGGKSKTRKVKVDKRDDEEKGEVYRVRWSSKSRDGYLSITGDTIDLSGVKDSAALMINMKLGSEVKESIRLSMDCGYPCEGQIEIKPLLERQPLDQWFSLPVALNCFEKEGLDLTKINAPMKLQTAGKLEMFISEVKLIRLPDGEKGCSSAGK